MNDIPDLIKNSIKDYFPGGLSAIDKDIQEMADRIDVLMISDSILTMMEYKSYTDKLLEGMQWMIYTWYMSFLQIEFMD